MDRTLRGLRVALLGFAAALLAACASYPTGAGYPGGAYPGSSYPGGYPSQGYGSQIVGTVQGVDPNNGRLMLAAEGSGSGYGGQVEVFFDNNTQLYYQGQQQSVSGLERGDRIRVDAVRENGRLWARTIEVIGDVRSSGGYGGGYNGGGYNDGGYNNGGYNGGSYGGGFGNELRGSVTGVDAGARLIRITAGGYAGAPQAVYFDGNTQVEYQGRYFRPEQLEPGDVVRIQAREWNGAWLAERVFVEVNARSR